MAKKRVLIIAPFLTHPSTSGASTRVGNSVDVLQDAGHQVHYAYVALSGEPSSEMKEVWGNNLHCLPYRHPSVHGTFKQRLNARVRKWLPNGNYSLKQNAKIDDWMDLSTKKAYQEIMDRVAPDVVICNYVWLSKFLDWSPQGCTKIIDTHDRFTNRFDVAAKAGKLNDWFSTSKTEELKGFKRADGLLSICEQDQSLFEDCYKIRSFYHPPFTPTTTSTDTHPIGQKILFIGNQNAANTRALDWFLSNCWHLILKQLPDAEMNVIGSVCEKANPTSRVNLHGRVNSISNYYLESKLSINPVPSGSGIAIKCLESLSYGRPVVATSSGARGLGVFDCIKIENQPKEFADTIVEILSDQKLWKSMSTKCHDQLTSWNEMSKENLLAAINS